MKIKSLCVLVLAATASLPMTSSAAFKAFSLDGLSATSYNEKGYTLGIDMVKKGGEKVFYANVLLPKDVFFQDTVITSTFSFDSEPLVYLSKLEKGTAVGKTDKALSWEIARLPDHVQSVPRDSQLYEFMKRYHFKFNYIDGNGNPQSTNIPMGNSAASISALIKR